MTIVVTGGSGFIGTALTKVLLAKEHTVIVIDRNSPTITHKNLFFIPCDLETSTLPFNVLERTDAVIHLAGKHTMHALLDDVQEKSEPVSSVTANLITSLEQTNNRPSIFISASSIGYYGPGYERELDERSAAGTSDTAKMIEQEEHEALQAAERGCRVVLVRTAPVVGIGGFMTPLFRAAKMHVTFRLTKEDFWMPWIHLNDLIHVYLFALETSTLQGVVNAVAPLPIRYSDFMRSFMSVTHSIMLPNIPFVTWPYTAGVREHFISQKVIPQRLLDKGFAFAYANITEAIADTAREAKGTR